jgi:hypothetical protein
MRMKAGCRVEVQKFSDEAAVPPESSGCAIQVTFANDPGIGNKNK